MAFATPHIAQWYSRIDVRNVSKTFADAEFRRCRFDGCKIGYTETSGRRLTVKCVLVKDCVADRCGLGPVVFEEVTIDGFDGSGFDGSGLQIINACAFRHVRLKGRIKRVNISAKPIAMAKQFSKNLSSANRKYHDNVDWALDISEAEFVDSRIEIDFRASLLRIDPTSQAFVRLANLSEKRWAEIKPQVCPVFAAQLDAMVRFQRPSLEVVIAQRGERDFDEQMNSLSLLRRAGLAEDVLPRGSG
jgi:hypothetical protein